MRVAPVGVLSLPLPEVAGLARRSAAVTHAHPLGTEGAAIQACAVALAVGTAPETSLDQDTFLAELSHHVRDDAYSTQIEQVRVLPAHASAHDVAARIGNDITALAAVPAAIAAFLRHPDSPAGTIRFAISMGGDTDTIATMAGALSGAHCGEEALPGAWLDRLEDPDGLRRLADQLAR